MYTIVTKSTGPLQITTHYNYRACSAMKPPAHSFCAVNARGGLELVVESVEHCCLSYTVQPALSDPHSLHVSLIICRVFTSQYKVPGGDCCCDVI